MSNDDSGYRGWLHPVFSFIHQLPPSDRLIFHILFATIIASGLWLTVTWSQAISTEISVPGGHLVEGVVGTPRFVNPVLATSRVDRDLSALIYRGVMGLDAGGALVPDLAREIALNEEATRYTITLRQDVTFHDGRPLTAADVVFTYQLISDADLKSPYRGNWSNVVVEQIDTFTFSLELPEPYTPFIENLTLGILPRHLWADIPVAEVPASTLNTNPIGTGPYKVQTVRRSEIGTITEYILQRADESAQLATVSVRIFPTVEELVTALQSGEITSTAMLPATQLENLPDNFTSNIIALPRTVAIFFNQNRSEALRSLSVRQALATALDQPFFATEGIPTPHIPNPSPIPYGYIVLESATTSAPTSSIERANDAETILTAAGWVRSTENTWERSTDSGTTTLAITLRTLNHPDFAMVAERVAEEWRNIGVEVRIEQFEQTDLTNSIIRPRDFEAILFGVDTSRSVDLYPFWHSSQQTDPGLNLTQYANIRTDRLLEQLREEQSSIERQEILQELVTVLHEELPAIFLYTPTMQYVTSIDLDIVLPARIQGHHDRFRLLPSWSLERERRWSFFH